MRHIIMTKHAIRISDALPASDWLEYRRDILHRVTAASLSAQTASGFEWLIFIAEEIFEDEGAALMALLPTELPVRLVCVPNAVNCDLDQAWSRLVGSSTPGTTVVSTILDSDDALAPEFCANLYSEVERQLQVRDAPFIIDFCEGLVVDATRQALMSRWYSRSAFQSLVEDPDSDGRVATVLSESHHLIADSYPYIRVKTRSPMWIMFIHGSNIANQAWGVPRDPVKLPEALRGSFSLKHSSPAARFKFGAAMTWRYAIYVVRAGHFVERGRAWARHAGWWS